MNSETERKITQLIGYAGAARSNYIKAIEVDLDSEKYDELIRQGDIWYDQAHQIHFKLLEENTEGYHDGMLLMIHAEDQLVSAETFRILSGKFRQLQQK